MRTRAGRAVLALALTSAFFAARRLAAGEQTASYRAAGAQAGLFDQYDIDGYSLAAATAPDGSVELKVRVVDFALRSAAPFRSRALPGAALVPAPDRDAFARERTKGSPTQAEAVRRLLLAIADEVRYDADRDRNQDPAAVFASRRAYCVGYAELAVDLMRRVGISARTVQGDPAHGPECGPIRPGNRRRLPPLDRGLLRGPRLRLFRPCGVDQRRRRPLHPLRPASPHASAVAAGHRAGAGCGIPPLRHGSVLRVSPPCAADEVS